MISNIIPIEGYYGDSLPYLTKDCNVIRGPLLFDGKTSEILLDMTASTGYYTGHECTYYNAIEDTYYILNALGLYAFDISERRLIARTAIPFWYCWMNSSTRGITYCDRKCLICYYGDSRSCEYGILKYDLVTGQSEFDNFDERLTFVQTKSDTAKFMINLGKDIANQDAYLCEWIDEEVKLTKIASNVENPYVFQDKYIYYIMQQDDGYYGVISEIGGKVLYKSGIHYNERVLGSFGGDCIYLHVQDKHIRFDYETRVIKEYELPYGLLYGISYCKKYAIVGYQSVINIVDLESMRYYYPIVPYLSTDKFVVNEEGTEACLLIGTTMYIYSLSDSKIFGKHILDMKDVADARILRDNNAKRYLYYASYREEEVVYEVNNDAVREIARYKDYDDLVENIFDNFISDKVKEKIKELAIDATYSWVVSRSNSLSIYCPQTDKRYYVYGDSIVEDISDDEADIKMDGVVCDRVYVISKKFTEYVQIDGSLFELPILDFRENLVAYRKSPSEIRIIDFDKKKVYSIPCLREEHYVSITAEFTFLEVLRKKCVLVIRNEEAVPNDFERTLLDAAKTAKEKR